MGSSSSHQNASTTAGGDDLRPESVREPRDRRIAARALRLSHDHRGLATEGLDALPQEVRKQGLAAIERLEQELVAAFAPVGGAEFALDCDLLEELLSTIGLLDFKLFIFTCGITTAGAFIIEICACLRKNPILVALGAELLSLPVSRLANSLPPAGEARDAEVRKAVVYCFMLHGLCNAVMQEPRRKASANAPPTLYKQIADVLDAMRKDIQWHKCAIIATESISLRPCSVCRAPRP